VNAALETVEDRVSRTGATTLQVAKWLETSGLVNRVLYPLLPSHPSYELVSTGLFRKSPKENTELCRGPGCLLFHVTKYKSEYPDDQWVWVTPWIQQYAKLLKLETSYGDKYCKIDCWPKLGSSDKYEQRYNAKAIIGTWIRLSVGYDSEANEIIDELQRLLTNLTDLPND
jgi:O-acetylhomoserine/O-acetylserine sulfhydrylase-like pyridoxal-dependent enzyme